MEGAAAIDYTLSMPDRLRVIADKSLNGEFSAAGGSGYTDFIPTPVIGDWWYNSSVPALGWLAVPSVPDPSGARRRRFR